MVVLPLPWDLNRITAKTLGEAAHHALHFSLSLQVSSKEISLKYPQGRESPRLHTQPFHCSPLSERGRLEEVTLQESDQEGCVCSGGSWLHLHDALFAIAVEESELEARDALPLTREPAHQVIHSGAQHIQEGLQVNVGMVE